MNQANKRIARNAKKMEVYPSADDIETAGASLKGKKRSNQFEEVTDTLSEPRTISKKNIKLNNVSL